MIDAVKEQVEVAAHHEPAYNGYVGFLRAYGPIIGACKHSGVNLTRVISHDIGNHITGVVGAVNLSIGSGLDNIPPVNLLVQDKQTVFDTALQANIAGVHDALLRNPHVLSNLHDLSMGPEAIDFIYRPDTLEAFSTMYRLLTDVTVDSYEKMKSVRLPLTQMLAYFGVPLVKGAPRASLPDGFSSFALLNFLGNAKEHGTGGKPEFGMSTNRYGTHYRVSNMSTTPWKKDFLYPGIKGEGSKGSGMGAALGVMFAQAGGYDLQVPAEGTKNIEFILSKK